MGYAVSLQTQQSQKRLIEALKSDFSRKTQFSRFCGIILVEKYTGPSRRWNLFFKHFGDQTNIKLLLQAEFAICIEIFQKKGNTDGLQLKNHEIWYFGSKSLLKTPLCGFSFYMLCKPITCPFSEKSRFKSQIPLATKVLY